MPRSDTCQPQVSTALEKGGWTILKTQVSIRKGDFIVYLDIEATKNPQQVFIEVKCFGSGEPSDQFYRALGQYIVYRRFLATQRPNHSLYLAIPEDIYTHFPEEYVSNLRENRVKLLLVNLEREEITRWIE